MSISYWLAFVIIDLVLIAGGVILFIRAKRIIDREHKEAMLALDRNLEDLRRKWKEGKQ